MASDIVEDREEVEDDSTEDSNGIFVEVENVYDMDFEGTCIGVSVTKTDWLLRNGGWRDHEGIL